MSAQMELPLVAPEPAPPAPPETAAPGRMLIAACAAIFLAAEAVRWWLVVSGRLVADGDECIVGLMGLYWLKGVPSLYFWGQPYGAGAGIESALAALLFKLFAPGAEALKAAGLIVWTAFALAAALAARLIFGRREAWLMLALVALFPAAGEWAMKIRGGHFLSFALFILALWPAARVWDRASRPLGWAALAATLLFLSPFLQPITLVPAGALALAALVGVLRRRAWAATVVIALGGIMVALLALYIAAVPGIKPHSSVEGDWLQAAVRVFAFAFLRFFTPWIDPASIKILPVEDVAAWAWLTATLAATIAGVREMRRPEGKRAALGLILVGIAATFPGAGLLATDNLQPRHLFPLYPLGCLLLARAGARLKPALLASGMVVLVLASATLNYRVATARYSFSPSTGARIRQETTDLTLKFLRERGIHHVFVADYDFKWNLAFFSGGDVIGRAIDPRDRVPAIVAEVNRAADENRPVAVIFIGQIDFNHGQIIEAMIAAPGVETFRPDPDVFVLTGVPPSIIYRYFLRGERDVEEVRRKYGRMKAGN